MPRGKSRKPLQMEQVGSNEWKFDYPHTDAGFEEQIDLGIDLMNEGKDRKAEKIFRAVIKTCPQHIDAHHYLAMLLSDRGELIEALEMWSQAVAIGLLSLPTAFVMGKSHLEWGCIENRPFLRASHGLGCLFLDIGELDNARQIFNDMLAMNPNDNQGIRAMAIKVAFAMDLPAEALRICNRFKGDCMVDTVYGRPLALFQMGRRAQAKKALQQAVNAYPLVARELLKKRHAIPKNMSSSYVTVGGADEAYDYWQNLGKFWKQTEGAMTLLSEFIPLLEERTQTTAILPFRR